MSCHWAVITGEYPPQAGGVADYTRQVCRGLAAAGDRVSVFAPPCSSPDFGDDGVSVVRLRDHFRRAGRSEATEQLYRLRPDCVLVQYVPHAFGIKGMNLPFAWWVRTLRRIAPVWVTFHEVAFPFVRRPLRHNLIAAANRLMARWVVHAADRVFVTIPAWGEYLRRLAPNSPTAEWLPVPSNLPTTVNPIAVTAVRTAHPGTLIGHFGTFGRGITALLEPCLATFLRDGSDRIILLIGRNGPAFRDDVGVRLPDLAGRIVATGELPPNAAAVHLAACDLLVQPYPDGVSGRRTSAVAGLALGVPLVSNRGALTEPVWTEETGVRLAATPASTELLAVCEQVLAESPAERTALGEAGRRWYAERFALDRTIAALREGRPS